MIGCASLWMLCPNLSQLPHNITHTQTCHTCHTTGQGTDEDIVVSSARAYAAALNKLLAWQAKQQHLQEEEEQEDHYSHAGAAAAAAAAAQDGNEEDSSSNGSGGGKGKKGFEEGSSKRLVAA